MFDIGFSELVVIALVGLIVLGPKRLPEVARTAGKWMARFRRLVADVKQDFDRELQHADLAELKKLREELNETRRVMEQSSSELMQQATLEPAPEPVIAQEPTIAKTPASMPAPDPAPAALPPLREPPAPRARRSPKRAPKTTEAKGKPGGSG